MKKLNTNNTGRMPFWQADLDWIQQAYTRPIEDIIKELGMLNASTPRSFFPVTGCRVSLNNGNISMSEGWFWWDGELLPVRALEITSTSEFTTPVVLLSLVSYNDSSGSRNFIQADQSNELVEDVWQDDYIEPSVVEGSGEQQTGIIILPGALTLYEFIKRRNEVFESEWIQIEGLQYGQSLRYKRIGSTVILQGRLRITTDSTPGATGLPEPLGGSANLITGKYIGEYEFLHWNFAPKAGELYAYVDNNGNLVVQQIDHDNSSDDFVFLNGMTYIAAEPYQESLIDMNVIVNI